VIRIVLVRPEGPRNVGSVLRLVANFGPAQLVLVRPERPSVLKHPEFWMMAHGAEHLVEGIRVVDSLDAALADCAKSYGFTGRQRNHRTLRDWREASAALVEDARHSELALVFGSEESGLSVEETQPLQELVRIPTSPEHESINLAMSVGLVLSTVFLSGAPSARHQNMNLVGGADRRFLVAHLQDALGALATSEVARKELVLAIERTFTRAPLEARDARAWHLLARALGNDKTPKDYGIGSEAWGSPSDHSPSAEPSAR
jgi:TrmH family RNA methyltransferase